MHEQQADLTRLAVEIATLEAETFEIADYAETMQLNIGSSCCSSSCSTTSCCSCCSTQG
jgi:thiazolylpeptide-type bacteriocin precursor